MAYKEEEDYKDGLNGRSVMNPSRAWYDGDRERSNRKWIESFNRGQHPVDYSGCAPALGGCAQVLIYGFVGFMLLGFIGSLFDHKGNQVKPDTVNKTSAKPSPYEPLQNAGVQNNVLFQASPPKTTAADEDAATRLGNSKQNIQDSRRADVPQPVLIEAKSFAARYEKSLGEGCEGQLTLSAEGLVFICPSNARKSFNISADHISFADKNGVIADDHKYHFDLGEGKDEDKEIFAGWVQKLKYNLNIRMSFGGGNVAK